MSGLLRSDLIRNKFIKWVPALLIMGVIFWFSSQPGDSLPNFDWADRLIKKTGHVVVYSLLSTSYWYAFDLKKNRRWLVWFLAILYSISDEYHQMFTKLRHPSVVDVFVFDNAGALLGIWFSTRWLVRKRQINDE